MLKGYDEQLHAAEQADVSYSEFVAGLLRAQWHDRQESALEWRIGRANLPERWSLETFPYARQPGVNRKQIRAFAELDFVAKHENLVLVGPTGVGKPPTGRVRSSSAPRTWMARPSPPAPPSISTCTCSTPNTPPARLCSRPTNGWPKPVSAPAGDAPSWSRWARNTSRFPWTAPRTQPPGCASNSSRPPS